MKAAVFNLVQMFRPDIGRLFRRFPLPSLAAFSFTLYFLLDLHHVGRLPEALQARLPWSLVVAFLWSLAAALFAEERRLSAARSWMAAGFGLAFLGGLIGFAEALELVPGPFLSSLVLLVGLAAYRRAPVNMAAFWLFNHRLWIALLLAFLAAGLLAGGVSGVFWTLQYLFGLQVSGWLHGKVWIIALCLVAPLNWLSLVPERFDQPVTEGVQTEFTSRAVALQVKFALVPLLLVYAVILHAYVVKILIDGSLPKGRIGWMVLIYGTAVAITALLAFPTRSQGGPLVRFFWRAWPWLLPAPVVLLFVAVGERIHQYGLTEGRYLLLMAGFWLAALAVTQGFVQAERRDLRLMPGLLAVLLGIASFGPWGMVALSSHTQARELVARLEAAGVVKGGQLPAEPRATVTLLPSDQQRVHGIIEYLRARGRLSLLRPLFAAHPKDPFAVSPESPSASGYGGPWRLTLSRGYGESGLKLAAAIRERLGLGSQLPMVTGQGHFSVLASDPALLPLDGPRILVGSLHLWSGGNTSPVSREVKGADGHFKIAFGGAEVTVHDVVSGRTAGFKLLQSRELLDRIHTSNSGTVVSRSPIVLKATSGDLPSDLVLTGASGKRGEGDAIEFRSINFSLVIAR